ncbi:MAG: hypothetical protein MAG795_01243 [Candidatus Woesearchaeota archaeon]|nr:hypothetical protein [Candidatus Woesearchaeota archaeon]
MVNVDIDSRIYEDVKQFVETNSLDYPSIKFFVQKALMERLKKIKK